MYKLFNDIIKGYLRPHLINNDNIDKLENLRRVEFVVEENEKGKIFKSSNDWLNHCLGEGQIIRLQLDDQNPGNNSFEIVQDENLEELININIPPPPNDIAEKYLTLIEREAELIKYKLNEFIKDSNDIKSNELYALKNIHILKELAEHLYVYTKKLGGEHGNLFITDTSHFVLYVLEEYIIDLIQYIQKIFSPFSNLNIESSIRLKNELFHVSIPRVPIFNIYPFLPKEKEFDDFKKEFLINNKAELLSNKLDRHGLSIGESLFKFYKSKYQNLSKNSQIENYNKVLYFWNELLITNKLKTIVFDIYKNEPEIEKILIPLLQNEIEFMEKEVKNNPISYAQIPDTQITLPEFENLKVSEFFELVLSCELGVLEIDNYIQRITHNFNKGKLVKLLEDIEFYLFVDRDERDANISRNDIELAIKSLDDQNKEIPHTKHGPLKNAKGEIITAESKVIDLEKLFYPHTYFMIYALIEKIKTLINEHNKAIPSQKVDIKTEQGKIPKVDIFKEDILTTHITQKPNAMTKHDFDLIIIEAFTHETKQSYFEAYREAFDCMPTEYYKGLVDSFKRLNEEANQKDYTHAVFTMPDGETREIKLNEENYPEQIMAIRRVGEKVSFPHYKSIDTFRRSGFKFSGKLTGELLASLWPDLKAYLLTLEPITETTEHLSHESEKNSNNEKPDFKKILFEIEGSDNQFWKGLPMVKVVEHFTVMTTRKNKNGDPFLTTEQLISFLKKGFLNDLKQQKQKINCSSGEKGFVIKRFYEFYNLTVAQYKHPAKKAKFIRLFNDCFDNWDENSVESFFKPNRVKENW